MNASYEEIIEGESLLRSAPGWRHEMICARLHQQLAAVLQNQTVIRLLPPRSVVPFGAGTLLRPDLALAAAATGKVWLAAEIVDSNDHRADTVTKKQIYEDHRIPRLWMADPRYDNLEVYHGTPHGLALRGILAGNERLTESLIPGLGFAVRHLFDDDVPPSGK